MKTQIDFLREAVALAEANPTLPIHIASSDEHCDCYGWTQQKITGVKIESYYEYGGEIFTDAEDVEDRFETDLETAEGLMKDVILIYTNA